MLALDFNSLWLNLYFRFPQRNNILLYCYFSALPAHGRSSIHGPKVGLSIMGVFVGLLLLAGLFVGVVRFRKFRKRMRAQKNNELSTLRDTVAFSRPSVCVSDLKGNGNGKKLMVIRRGKSHFDFRSWFTYMKKLYGFCRLFSILQINLAIISQRVPFMQTGRLFIYNKYSCNGVLTAHKSPFTSARLRHQLVFDLPYWRTRELRPQA